MAEPEVNSLFTISQSHLRSFAVDLHTEKLNHNQHCFFHPSSPKSGLPLNFLSSIFKHLFYALYIQKNQTHGSQYKTKEKSHQQSLLLISRHGRNNFA